MNLKKIYSSDNFNTKEKASIGKRSTGDTEIIFRDLDTGEVIDTLHNRIVIAGSQFTAMKHFDLPKILDLPSYNTSLGLEHSSASTSPTNIPKICLFCCGTDGCGINTSMVKPEPYLNRIKPSMPAGSDKTFDIVPFQYRLTTNDLDASDRTKYFGRKTEGQYVAYYFKAFETQPQMYARYIDADGVSTTTLTSDVYNTSIDKDAEFFVETKLIITKEDFRDFHKVKGFMNDIKINSISLLTGWYTEEEGYKWYQDIQPMTLLHIPNESLVDSTKGIEITYHIYY